MLHLLQSTCACFIEKGFISFQINAVKSFAQTLRRYTGLNHLAQAARAVLQNSSQVSQMLNDLNKVDFANVQEQVQCRVYFKLIKFSVI